MQGLRVKVSLSLPPDLVARIDRVARAESRSRSRVVERWLRRAAREGAHRELEEATIAYYESLTPEELRQDSEMAAALSRAGRRLDIDALPRPRRAGSRSR